MVAGKGLMVMISREETVTFVWRCPDCPAGYDGDGLAFLHADVTPTVCPCGGRLVEELGSVPVGKQRIVVSAGLRGSALHRELRRRGVEVAFGERSARALHGV